MPYVSTPVDQAENVTMGINKINLGRVDLMKMVIFISCARRRGHICHLV